MQPNSGCDLYRKMAVRNEQRLILQKQRLVGIFEKLGNVCKVSMMFCWIPVNHSFLVTLSFPLWLMNLLNKDHFAV